MEVISDFKKIIKQALGRENMFGFRTTFANQLYLIHCCLGNVYFTDEIHQTTKYLWFFWANSPFLWVVHSIISYLMYCRQTEDILLVIYISYHALVVLLLLLVRPAIGMLWYRNDIEQMILMTDKIMSSKGQSWQKFDMKKLAIKVAISVWLILGTYMFVVTIDIMLFYEEEKTKNYLYYVTVPCGIDRYGSLDFYNIYNMAYFCGGVPATLMIMMYFLFPVLWVAACYNEAYRIIDELNSFSARYVDIEVGSDDSFKQKFTEVIRKSVHEINDLTKMISHFKIFFEAIAGVMMPLYLYISIIHALIIVTPGYPLIVKMREISGFLATVAEVYLICWVGAKLEDMASVLSFAVYSTPWYQLKSIRKNVYIHLCQTQSPIEPFALSVYPLKLATFMRFCNSINSAVNVFRAYRGIA